MTDTVCVLNARYIHSNVAYLRHAGAEHIAAYPTLRYAYAGLI
jgi:hypothetical protein